MNVDRETGQQLLQRNAFSLKVQEVGKLLLMKTILQTTSASHVSPLKCVTRFNKKKQGGKWQRLTFGYRESIFLRTLVTRKLVFICDHPPLKLVKLLLGRVTNRSILSRMIAYCNEVTVTIL